LETARSFPARDQSFTLGVSRIVLAPGVLAVDDQLPKRDAGTHLPPEAYRAVGVAKVPNVDPDRWYVDERTLMVIVNALRRWQINDRGCR
jgi:hypothetical protein